MFLAPRASTCFARNDVHRNLLLCTCHLTALHCLPIKQCPVCMGILRNTWTVMECMHRFCGNCIQRCLRGGKQECPSCRVHVGSRRSLRQDHNFDALIRSVFKNVDAYEAEQRESRREAQQHSGTRLNGAEGLLVDTGAVNNLCGQDFVTRMDHEARRSEIH